MATTTAGKRKTTHSLGGGTKRQRVDMPSPEEPTFQSDDDDEDVYEEKNSQDNFSDGIEIETADTPLTPFSPGRKKFASELKTIKCTYEGCTKTFNRPARLQDHLRSHTKERPFVCTYEGCDKSYTQDKHLQQHIKGSHTKERPYPCDWEGCSKVFLTATRLRRHKDVHEGHERFRCTAYPPCNQTFRKHQTLQRHIRSEHLELAPFPCTYIDPITLVSCDAGFDQAGGLRNHQQKVHSIPQFFCPECIIPDPFLPDGSPMHLGFQTNTQLQAHIKKDHANCPFCDRRCSSKRELDKHVESQHSGTTLAERKTIACTYEGCDKTFTKKANLQVHISSVHEGQRYICGTFDVAQTPDPDLSFWDSSNSCGKDFVSKASLADHVRTAHLGLPSVVNANRKKPDPKPRKRTRKPKVSAIDELIGNGHANDERRKVSCPFSDCPSRFTRNHDLGRHLRSKHRLSTPEIEDLADPKTEFGNEVGLAHEEDRGGLDAMYEQANVDWEARDHAADEPFWIGADDYGAGESQDQWFRDEMEMRKLIDEGGLGEYLDDGGFDDI